MARDVHAAIVSNDVSELSRLLAADTCLANAVFSGRSALASAVLLKRTECAKALIQAGASVSTITEGGDILDKKSLLSLVSASEELVPLVCNAWSAGQRAADDDGLGALSLAFSCLDWCKAPSTARALAESVVAARGGSCNAALCLAAYHGCGDSELAHWLSAGADVNGAVSATQLPPIACAVWSGRVSAVRFLAERGAALRGLPGMWCLGRLLQLFADAPPDRGTAMLRALLALRRQRPGGGGGGLDFDERIPVYDGFRVWPHGAVAYSVPDVYGAPATSTFLLLLASKAGSEGEAMLAGAYDCLLLPPPPPAVAAAPEAPAAAGPAADVNAVGVIAGRTVSLLRHAAQRGRVLPLQRLLAAGADLEDRAIGDGASPLDAAWHALGHLAGGAAPAALSRQLEVLRLLLAAGARVTSPCGLLAEHAWCSAVFPPPAAAPAAAVSCGAGGGGGLKPLTQQPLQQQPDGAGTDAISLAVTHACSASSGSGGKSAPHSVRRVGAGSAAASSAVTCCGACCGLLRTILQRQPELAGMRRAAGSPSLAWVIGWWEITSGGGGDRGGRRREPLLAELLAPPCAARWDVDEAGAPPSGGSGGGAATGLTPPRATLLWWAAVAGNLPAARALLAAGARADLGAEPQQLLPDAQRALQSPLDVALQRGHRAIAAAMRRHLQALPPAAPPSAAAGHLLQALPSSSHAVVLQALPPAPPVVTHESGSGDAPLDKDAVESGGGSSNAPEEVDHPALHSSLLRCCWSATQHPDLLGSTPAASLSSVPPLASTVPAPLSEAEPQAGGEAGSGGRRGMGGLIFGSPDPAAAAAPPEGSATAEAVRAALAQQRAELCAAAAAELAAARRVYERILMGAEDRNAFRKAL